MPKAYFNGAMFELQKMAIEELTKSNQVTKYGHIILKLVKMSYRK